MTECRVEHAARPVRLLPRQGEIRGGIFGRVEEYYRRHWFRPARFEKGR